MPGQEPSLVTAALSCSTKGVRQRGNVAAAEPPHHLPPFSTHYRPHLQLLIPSDAPFSITEEYTRRK
ncbi:hypothetical protein E2C01_033916 [Portunus trituberculatus]|uniref:Uncharacterized protein n=1 Tax=Portunus trituberculatus TaxID=210409 RepID=A0A5B7EZ61_PORTR|nr:hypothetical protein [Portunus trituberculatus]